jgi:hypothetical protein
MSVPFSLVLDGTDTGSNSITGTADNLPAFSVSLWFKTSSPSTGTLIGKALPSNFGWNMIFNTTGFVSMEISGTSTFRFGQTGTGLNDGAWHNVISVYNAPTLTLYVDGVSVFSGGGAPIGSYSSIDTIKVGNPAINTPFVGKLCDIKIYSIALSSGDVTSIYAGGEPQAVSRLLEWPVTEGSGVIAHDFTGNGNTLTFNAVAWSSDVPSQLAGSTLTLHIFDSQVESDSFVRGAATTKTETQGSSDARIMKTTKGLSELSLVLVDSQGKITATEKKETLITGSWFSAVIDPASNIWNS